MLKFYKYLIISAFFALIKSGVAVDLELFSHSPTWEVRYCIPTEIDFASPSNREILERLSSDEHLRVASHAFAAYSRLFVSLDKGLVKSALDRGHLSIVGISVTGVEVFRSASFWQEELVRVTDDSSRARALRAIGLCGSETDLPALREYLNSTNPYLLTQLALALHRLGDVDGYLEALESVMQLPVSDAMSYQTEAVNYLIQTHPDKARQAWLTVQERAKLVENLRPAWVFEHTVQEERLP